MNGKKRTFIALGLSAALFVGAAAMIAGGGLTEKANAVAASPETYSAASGDSLDSPAYSHTVTWQEAYLLKLMGQGSLTADNLDWTYIMDGSFGDFVEGKGLAFDADCESAILFSDAFHIDNKTLINKVVVNASRGSNNEGASLSVLVNGTLVGTESLAYEAQDYEFVLEKAFYGSVEIVLDQSSASTKDCLYLSSISIFAEEDEDGTQIVPAILALDEIKTCEVEGGDATFGNFLDVFQGTVDDYESVLSKIYMRDYASFDTSYEGEKTGRVNFMDKYSYCLERYNAGTASSLLSLSSGEENIYVAACALLTIATASIATFLIIKKRKAA